MPDNNQVSISPDGRTVTYVARAEGGKIMLFVRPIDSVGARPLAGTENAWGAFWSPDSRYIAFQIGVQPDAHAQESHRRLAVRPRALHRVGRARGTGTTSSFAWTAESFLACQRQEARSPGLQPRTRLFKRPRIFSRTSFLTAVTSSISRGRRAREPRPLHGPPRFRSETRIMTAESRAVYAPPAFFSFIVRGRCSRNIRRNTSGASWQTRSPRGRHFIWPLPTPARLRYPPQEQFSTKSFSTAQNRDSPGSIGRNNNWRPSETAGPFAFFTRREGVAF